MDVQLQQVSTGISGLDEILNGGLVAGRLYLLRGKPGTGKTLVGMHFLQQGLHQDETVLYVNGEESKENILTNASKLGIDIGDAVFLDIGPTSEYFSQEDSYDIVEPHDINANSFIDDIRSAIADTDPDRIFIDPITQLRYVEPNEFHYRKRLISLTRHLTEAETTVLAAKTKHETEREGKTLPSLSDGIISLSRNDNSRRIRVAKHRGVGAHTTTSGLAIHDDGLAVYPELVPEHNERHIDPDRLASGIDGLDTLLKGGIERGTTTFISGPTGVGKSTTGTQFLCQAAERGDNPVAFLFEESVGTFRYRADQLGLPVSEHIEAGDLSVHGIEPLTLSPEEFADQVTREVERRDCEVVMLDGINGYQVSMLGQESLLESKMHALIRYLKNMDVTVLIMDEMAGISGLESATSANLSYLADNILVLNYTEIEGELYRVIGALKKRVGNFEQRLREFDIRPSEGIVVGDPIEGIQGVIGGNERLLEQSPSIEDREER